MAGPAPTSMKFPRILTLTLAAALAAAVGWFYFWTVGSPRLTADQPGDYYNLLADGFRDGHLAMKVTPDPWLGVDNTKATAWLLDASFYKGKYYLYFGVTPALLVFWPWAVITGWHLPEASAAMGLAILAFALSLGWLRTLRRRFFPEAGGLLAISAVLLLGLGAGYAVVLRRPLFYEVAILSGVVCSVGCLWCLTLAVIRQPAHAWRWLGAGSLLAGLAGGSRPTLIPGAIGAMVLAAMLLGRRDREAAAGAGSWRPALRPALAALGPLGLCLLGLAWYNWARFENPLEFGLHHQLGSNGNGFPFRLDALWQNLGLYYFTPPDFSWFFPFFFQGPSAPASYAEQVHGQFFWLPLLGLAGVAGWSVSRRQGWRSAEVLVLLPAVAWLAGALTVVGLAPVHSNRYQLDFHPVLAALVVTGLGVWLQARRAGKLALVVLGVSGLIAVFNVCTSFQVHGFFQERFPRQFAALARVADRAVWPLHELAGARLGGLELVVKFPAGIPGTIEPLLVAGGGTEMDALLVKYTTPGRARLVFDHLGYGEAESEEFNLEAGRARWLKIHLGTLYPPPWHPWYDNLPPDMARATNRVAVSLDGIGVLQRDVVCYRASANQVVLGARGDFPVGTEKFSGEVARVRGLKADLAWLQGLAAPRETLRLRLELPRDRFGETEPLVLTGGRDRAEFVDITYVRDGVVRFSVLHDGWPAPVTSPEFEWNYLKPLEVRISLGSLRPKESIRPDGVLIETDGRILLSQVYETHPARPAQVYLGCLPWPRAGSRLMFTGRISSEVPGSAEEAPLRRAKQALLAGRPVRLRLTLPAAAAGGQPVFTLGRTGAGDGLYVEFLSATAIRLGFDHWGSPPLLSAPVPARPGAVMELEVTLGARLSHQLITPGRLEVRLDGRKLLDQPAEFFPAGPEQLFFGQNPIGMSTSQPEFAGKLELTPTRPTSLTNP